jgi:TfoX/Sxy family transcriptional regulator of competence genes
MRLAPSIRLVARPCEDGGKAPVRQTLKSYYEVPPEVLDDREALLSWARQAIRARQDSQDRAG